MICLESLHFFLSCNGVSFFSSMSINFSRVRENSTETTVSLLMSLNVCTSSVYCSRVYFKWRRISSHLHSPARHMSSAEKEKKFKSIMNSSSVEEKKRKRRNQAVDECKTGPLEESLNDRHVLNSVKCLFTWITIYSAWWNEEENQLLMRLKFK